jgi:hypothetical protein
VVGSTTEFHRRRHTGAEEGRGIWGESTDRWGPAGDDRGMEAITDRRFACWVGPGHCSNRPVRRKMARELFQILNSLFQLINPHERNKLERKYLGISEKYKIFAWR